MAINLQRRGSGETKVERRRIRLEVGERSDSINLFRIFESRASELSNCRSNPTTCRGSLMAIVLMGFHSLLAATYTGIWFSWRLSNGGESS